MTLQVTPLSLVLLLHLILVLLHQLYPSTIRVKFGTQPLSTMLTRGTPIKAFSMQKNILSLVIPGPIALELQIAAP
jgi:hypothetical protein